VTECARRLLKGEEVLVFDQSAVPRIRHAMAELVLRIDSACSLNWGLEENLHGIYWQGLVDGDSEAESRDRQLGGSWAVQGYGLSEFWRG
jgi:hypothetical protein